jgi:hypothetical protein
MNMKEETWDLRKAVRKAFKDLNEPWSASPEMIENRLCKEITSKIQCPYVVNADEGTSHCELANSSVTALKAELFKCKERLEAAQKVVEAARMCIYHGSNEHDIAALATIANYDQLTSKPQPPV